MVAKGKAASDLAPTREILVNVQNTYQYSAGEALDILDEAIAEQVEMDGEIGWVTIDLAGLVNKVL